MGLPRPVGTAVRLGAALIAFAAAAAAHETEPGGGSDAGRAILRDPAQALAYSQQAIGRSVGDHRFTTARGESFSLASTRGKPLVVNLVYTSCSDACPVTVQTLARAVDVARSAVGLDRFNVVTIGFDAHADSPQRMHDFARAQGIDVENWRFLSADAATIERLSRELGFLAAPRSGGFDHLDQISLIDRDGRVYRQIYGSEFAPQTLVEPLKLLVFGGDTAPTSFAGLLDRVKLLCTVFDPSTGRYRFSYAIFVEVIAGGLSLAAVGALLLRLWLQARRPLSPRP